jgi:hypothetical protein
MILAMVLEIFRLISPFTSLASNTSFSLRALVILAYSLDIFFVRRLVESQNQPDSVFSSMNHTPADGDDTDDQFTPLPNSSDDFLTNSPNLSTTNRQESQTPQPFFRPPVDSCRINMQITGSLMVQDPHFNLLMADSG